MDIIRRAIPALDGARRLRPVTAPVNCGRAGLQAAAIADRIFSEASDAPLHLAIAIRRGDLGRLRIVWTHGDDDVHNSVKVSYDHLYSTGVAEMEEAARWIMGEELRHLAKIAAGPGQEDATWAVMTSPLIADMVARLRIEPESTTTEIGHRICRAFRQRGGDAELRMHGALLAGTMRPQADTGRPSVSVTTAGGQRDSLTVTVTVGRMPDTIVEALPGRRLDAVLELGPASADMTIADAEMTGGQLTLRLTGLATTLMAVPDGIDRRWIAMLGEEYASL